ncbi:hypothetical protein D0865_07730 [Hortaea werneckii]|uniref:Uncharacterized protein n=1 Tax=Hortaea werneckii TaxID=91943 RepID=A0A3M7CB24_HORWE|nr:hypothetical protein D0865_07730 [Hortaea werneckii]
MDSNSTQTPSQPSGQAPDRGSRHRGPRRGRGRGQSRRGGSLAFRPASVAPDPQNVSTASDEGLATQGASAKPGQTRRGRGRGNKTGQSRTVNGRQFGGQLTHDGSSCDSASAAVTGAQAGEDQAETAF